MATQAAISCIAAKLKLQNKLDAVSLQMVELVESRAAESAAEQYRVVVRELVNATVERAVLADGHRLRTAGRSEAAAAALHRAAREYPQSATILLTYGQLLHDMGDYHQVRAEERPCVVGLPCRTCVFCACVCVCGVGTPPQDRNGLMIGVPTIYDYWRLMTI